MTSHLNVEVKARCKDAQLILRRLEALGAVSQGVDDQRDTYLPAANGRLKLREGGIENSLIHYVRPNQEGPKDSWVTLHELDPERALNLRHLLVTALGVIVVVEKRRHILWIDNVKFHVDSVTGLGSFVEIEAIDRTGDIGRPGLLEQCQRFIALLEIADTDLESRSYSDMLMPVD